MMHLLYLLIDNIDFPTAFLFVDLNHALTQLSIEQKLDVASSTECLTIQLHIAMTLFLVTFSLRKC